MATKTADPVISIERIDRAQIEIGIVGTTPILCNRMQEKAMQQLLFPEVKTAATRAASLKHNPPEEFRGSPYLLANDDAPTYLAFLASAFRQAIAAAALDVPGARKAQVGRLVWVEGDPKAGRLPLWGKPMLHMGIVRSADMNRTPDVRTRCCLAEWATVLQITFPPKLIREQAVVNLLAAAGDQVGVGDGRNEKGNLRFGCFRLTNLDDEQLLTIQRTGGRKVQQAAMEDPEPFDEEAQELLAWWRGEVARRGVNLDKAA